MDFARRQLEKYGWSDGKGLGKHENGISKALKPKLKRSVTGIGHDAAAEFNEHWWSALYDKAAKNVEVEEKNGRTKKIKTINSEDFIITNSTWRSNKKKSDNVGNEYSEHFIRKAVLTNDGIKVENDDSESASEGVTKDVFKMTDEELFKACEGRTAHKGARHGLKAVGKLARIAQQEKLLLPQSKYQEYSHAKKIKKSNEKVVENTSLDDNEEECKRPKNKKKKKRKCCSSNEDTKVISDQAESDVVPLHNNVGNLKNKNGDTCCVKEIESGRNANDSEEQHNNMEDSDSLKKTKKKKKHMIKEVEADLNGDNSGEILAVVPKKKKKKYHQATKE